MSANLYPAVNGLQLIIDPPLDNGIPRDDISKIKVWYNLTNQNFNPLTEGIECYSGDSTLNILIPNLDPINTYYIKYGIYSYLDESVFDDSTTLVGKPLGGTVSVTLTTSTQVFNYSALGVSPSPSNSVITAITQNITGTIYYEFLVAGIQVKLSTDNWYTYTPQSDYTGMPQQVTVKVRTVMGSAEQTVLAQDSLSFIGVKPGEDGADGTSVSILGSVSTYTNLPGYPSSYTGSTGDGYLVEDTGHLWIWNDNNWTDAGNIRGPQGSNATRTAILEVYKVAATAPTEFPVGNSTYTWSTGQFSPPSNLNGWSLTPPAPVTNQTLWVARTIYTDNNISTDSVVTWNATVARPVSTSGANGLDGNRTAVLELYKWSATIPTDFPSGTSTYTWATGQFTLPATNNDWLLAPGTPSEGQKLYACSITYSDTSTTATSNVVWNTNLAYIIGTAAVNGTNGKRTAILEVYQVSAATPTQFPAGNSEYTWATGQFTAPAALNGWSLTPPAPVTNQTLWVARTTYTDNSTSTTSTIGWNTTVARPVSSSGSNGTHGKRTAILEVYQVSAATPTQFPVGNSTYTWATGQFTAPATLNGWSLTPPAPVTNQTLWVARTIYTDNSVSTESEIGWNATVARPVSSSGINGNNAISAILSNESHTFPASKDGAVTSYVNSGTEIRVYEGTTELIYDGIGTSNSTWKVLAEGTDITPGTITDSGTYATIEAHTGVANATIIASIKYTITGKTSTGSSFSIIKTQTFSKSKAGVDATNPIIYDIITSAPIITKEAPDAATSGTHSSITIQGKKYDGNTTTNYGWITVTPNGGTEANTATDTAGGAYTLSPANTDGKLSYTIKMYSDQNKTQPALDTQVVNIVFKGNTGVNGKRTAVLELYKWASETPTQFPSGNSEYTWATGAFTLPTTNNGWQLVPGASSPGQTLYGCSVAYTDNDTTNTSVVAWNTNVAYALGAAGNNGKRTAVLELYKWASETPTQFPSGNSEYTWATGAFTLPTTNNGWLLVPGTPSSGQKLYGCTVTYTDNGITNTSVVTWNTSTAYALGMAGTNAISGFLTNEAATVAAATDGTVDEASFTGAGGTFKVYNGTTDVTANSTFSVVGTPNITININTAGVYTVTALTAPTVNVTLTAEYGGVTITKIYTISKSIAGIAGTNARSVDLTTTTQAFAYNSSGTSPSPANTVITATAQNTTGTVYYEFILAGTSVQNTTTNTYTYTPQSNYDSMPQQIVVKIREGANNSTVLAQDTISLYGIKPGSQGNPGINASWTKYVYAYKLSTRANDATASTPPNTPTDGIFTIDTLQLTTAPTGWQVTQPASTGGIVYVSRNKVGPNNGTTGTIALSSGWSTPIPASQILDNGATYTYDPEANLSTYSSNVGYATVYTKSSATGTVPSTPSGGTVLFNTLTQTITAPTGWFTTIAGVDADTVNYPYQNPLFKTTATINTTSDILSYTPTWTAPEYQFRSGGQISGTTIQRAALAQYPSSAGWRAPCGYTAPAGSTNAGSAVMCAFTTSNLFRYSVNGGGWTSGTNGTWGLATTFCSVSDGVYIITNGNTTGNLYVNTINTTTGLPGTGWAIVNTGITGMVFTDIIRLATGWLACGSVNSIATIAYCPNNNPGAGGWTSYNFTSIFGTITLFNGLARSFDGTNTSIWVVGNGGTILSTTSAVPNSSGVWSSWYHPTSSELFTGSSLSNVMSVSSHPTKPLVTFAFSSYTPPGGSLTSGPVYSFYTAFNYFKHPDYPITGAATGTATTNSLITDSNNTIYFINNQGLFASNVTIKGTNSFSTDNWRQIRESDGWSWGSIGLAINTNYGNTLPYICCAGSSGQTFGTENFYYNLSIPSAAELQSAFNRSTPQVGDVISIQLNTDSVQKAKSLNYTIPLRCTAITSTGTSSTATWSRVSAWIDGDMVVTGSITADSLAVNSIIAEKIQADAITADKIAANAITADKINAGAITATKIFAGAVTSDKIDDNAIVATKIAAGAITADKINVNNLSAVSANLGSITGGSLALGGIAVSQTSTDLGTIANTAFYSNSNFLYSTKYNAATGSSLDGAYIKSSGGTIATIISSSLGAFGLGTITAINGNVYTITPSVGIYSSTSLQYWNNITNFPVRISPFGIDQQRNVTSCVYNSGTNTLTITTDTAFTGSFVLNSSINFLNVPTYRVTLTVGLFNLGESLTLLPVFTNGGALLNNDGTFIFGKGTSSISFDGTSLNVVGNIVTTGNIVANAITSSQNVSGTVSSGSGVPGRIPIVYDTSFGTVKVSLVGTFGGAYVSWSSFRIYRVTTDPGAALGNYHIGSNIVYSTVGQSSGGINPTVPITISFTDTLSSTSGTYYYFLEVYDTYLGTWLDDSRTIDYNLTATLYKR